MVLPPEALAALRAALPNVGAVGDIWWLPAAMVRWFPGGKDRYVLIAGLERTGASSLAHLVAGSTNMASGPLALHVPGATAGPGRDTYFKFFVSRALPVSVLNAEGEWKGRVAADRHAEIESAVRASKLVALKRVWS